MMEPRASDKESFDGMMKAFYQVVKGETCYMSDDEGNIQHLALPSVKKGV